LSAEVDFDVLCAEREQIRNFVLTHPPSLQAFAEPGRPWFRNQVSPDRAKNPDKTVRHLTTTASCLQSLFDVPLYSARKSPPPPCPHGRELICADRNSLCQGFAEALLSSDEDVWQSEGQKLVYTKVRTLPIILDLADEALLRQFGGKISSLTKDVWAIANIADPDRQALGEIPEDGRDPYPPNAFHTYWGLRLTAEYERRGAVLPKLPSAIRQKRAVALLWARRTLAAQTALIASGQDRVDAHQLAWALSTDVLCQPQHSDHPTTAEHQRTDLYRASLKAFFSEQREGVWRLYQPLFHYRRAGNAYCYSFETLAELLRLALLRQRGALLRSHLRPYVGNLIAAWHFARDTAINLNETGARGWSSGHHPHRTEPEAWATASVYSYLQHLRALLGHWAVEDAKLALSAKPISGGALSSGLATLQDRGDTWASDGERTVGRKLSMLFVNPVRAIEEERPRLDPDEPLVDESRSALLFGPPGTGKTTLVRGVADALGWDYVEVLASDFLSEGLNQVPRAADKIFKQLMELDHCVILFDEIDELIRVRDDAGSDPFGRFLTTSMLPKLAKLWEQRRVLFFVNTNDIETADPAIRRSQRFDAAIFVPPPSFEKKKKRLVELIGSEIPLLESKRVEAAITGSGSEDPALGVFALLRWDQLDDLAQRVRASVNHGGDLPGELIKALHKLGEDLARTDWRPHGGSAAETQAEYAGGELGLRRMFDQWCRQRANERRDHQRQTVMRLDQATQARNNGLWRTYGLDGQYAVTNGPPEEQMRQEDGVLCLQGADWTAVDVSGTYYFQDQGQS
jgi:hypothetical protein